MILQVMTRFSAIWKGLILSLLIALPSYALGLMFPVVGGPIIAIVQITTGTIEITMDLSNELIKAPSEKIPA